LEETSPRLEKPDVKEWDTTDNGTKTKGRLMDINDLNQLYENGEEHRRKGQFIEAISAYRQILVQAPDSPHILRRLGECLLKKGVPREAVSCFHEAIKRDPDDPGQYHLLAQAHRQTGDMDKALIALERASSLEPGNVSYQVDLGWCLADLGAMKNAAPLQERAISAFKTALTINPRDPGVLEGLASLYKDTNRIDLALDAIEKALELDPYDLDRLELKDRILRRWEIPGLPPS
jgi:tetratricopeptide (TPR) repeat protein